MLARGLSRPVPARAPDTLVGARPSGHTTRVFNRWRHTLTATAVGVAVMLAACAPAQQAAMPSSAPTRATATAEPPDGLSASLVQYRRDQARRVVEVKLANAGAAALRITLLDVTLPGFTETGPVGRTTNLKADRRVDLPVPLGEPVCEEPVDGSAVARLEVSPRTGGTVRTVVPVDDDGLLARLHGFDCALRRAHEVTDITLTPAWEPSGEGRDLTVAGEASVVLTDPSATVRITDVAGNLLFVAVPETITPPPPVRLDRTATTATIRFELLPARCDGHAIAEAKRLTTVAFMVSVDGAESVPIRRPPDDPGFDTLVRALNERCAAL